jgi:RNA polymerase sigma factor (sigma-70 family)
VNFWRLDRQVSGVDSKAFERLFELHFEPLYGYLARRVGPELARDLAAETFAQALRSRRTFDRRRGEARPWLFGIAQNVLRRHYRDEERRLQALAGIDAPSERAREEPRLASALATLTPEERDVLLLHVWADMTYHEIAGSLAVPIGTVRSRLSRARLRLREALIEEEQTVDG